MKKSILPTALIAFVLAVLTACNNGSASPKTDSSAEQVDSTEVPAELPQEVKELVEAVADSNPRKFASAVSYPLPRPYPLRNVEDSAEMVEYYPRMVDDSLRNVIVKSGKEKWSSNGWRGWTLHDGQYLWIDDKLYAVNYVSRAEQAQIDTLVNQEIGSLQEGMRKGWRPVFCLYGTDSGMVFRVDCLSHPDKKLPYRLAVYDRGANLHGRPSMMMRGDMEVEGTVGARTYKFVGRDGSRAYYIYDRSSDDEVQEIYIVTPQGDSIAHPVKDAYWRDFISGR